MNNQGYVYNTLGDYLDFKGEIEQHRGGQELSVTYIRIEVISGNSSAFDQSWGTSVYFTNSQGQALSGLSLPSFINNKVSISDMLANLGISNFKSTTTHFNNQNRLIITVEDEAKNLSSKEYILLITNNGF